MSKSKTLIVKEENEHIAPDIIVVDDMRFNLQLLLSVLETQGYEVRPALDGYQALLAVQSQLPDLILLDIMMPGMDGYEVCRRLKEDEQTRDIPIIFMSGLDETLDKVRAFSAGGVDYITKPFEIEEVLARVETHLVLRNLQKNQQKKNQALQEEVVKRRQAEQLLAQYSHILEQRVHERTTKLAQATREAEEARLAAEAASEAKSLFLARVSHELRTPLNAILGFAQVITHSRTLPDEQQENLDIINKNGQHLLKLINNILDFSKLKAGHMQLNETNFDLYQLLTKLEAIYFIQAKIKRLKFEIIQDSNLPRYVRTDSVKLHQVLSSLIDNAIKFTSQGSVCLRASVISTDTMPSLPTGIAHLAYANLHFEVQDTGVGIAPNELEHIFSAFVQSDAGKQKEKGAGLGLSLSRQFVKLMGGEMSVTSQMNDSISGHRTIFKFNILVNLVHSSDIKEIQFTQDIINLEPNQPPINEPYTPEALAALPISLLAQLREAAEGSDIEMMEDVLAQIRLDYPISAVPLTRLANDFEYDKILELLGLASAL